MSSRSSCVLDPPHREIIRPVQHDGFLSLLARARAGDSGAIDEILTRVRPHLEKVSRRFVDRGHPEESLSDLVQETWVRAWQRIDQFEGGTDDEGSWRAFLAWIGQAAHRLGINAVRDRNALRRGAGERHLRLDRPAGEDGGRIEPPAAGPSPSTAAGGDERMRRVRAALEKLPDANQREIVRLHVFEGVSLRAIGERLALTYDQVRDRYRAAMRRLESDLEGLL